MADGEKDGRPSSELLDKYFDSFKHISTLGVALAVVFLAISRAEALAASPGSLARMSLGFFALSFALSLTGMIRVIVSMRPGSENPGELSLYLLLVASTALLVAGVVGFMLSVLFVR